jgi:hypothetical protein
MSKKEIIINPVLFNLKKNQTRKVKPILSPSTIKRELLSKIKSKSPTSDTILNSLQELEIMTNTDTSTEIEPDALEKETERNTEKNSEHFLEKNSEHFLEKNSEHFLEKNSEQPLEKEPPYGCIKNGNKPTFRRWTQSAPKKTKTIKQYASFGKNNHTSTVRVFIHHDKRKLDTETRALDKHDMNKVRTYLKTHGLLKVGSTAPDDILRESYKNSILAGNIHNKSKDVLVHNFMQDT